MNHTSSTSLNPRKKRYPALDSASEPLKILILGLLVLFLAACSGAAGDYPDYESAPAESMPEATSLPIESGEALTATPLPTLASEQPEPSEPEIVEQTYFPENRLLAFEWPRGIRVGDSDIIRLSLTVDEEGNLTPTVVFEEHELTNKTVQIENLYNTHLIRAEARLDMAGVEVVPDGVRMQRMFPGEEVVFSWSLAPPESGTYRGNVWLFVRYTSMEDENDQEERLIFTQPVEIEGLNLLGLGGQPARILGLIGVFISTFLGLDDIIGLLRKFLRR